MITFWHGRQGYDVRTRKRDAVPKHDGYEFRLKNPVNVEVYKIVGTNPLVLLDTLTGVELIRVLALNQSNHGNQLDPPW